MTSRSGFRIPYEVKEAGDKGLGVFARAPVARGQILWRHLPGLYTVYDEAGFKAAIAGMPRAAAIYELVHVFGRVEFPGCLIRVWDDGVLINHATDQNAATNIAVPQKQQTDPASPDYLQQVTAALLEDRYCLIATRDIEAGEELTNDYLSEVEEPPFYEALYEEYGVDEDYLDT